MNWIKRVSKALLPASVAEAVIMSVCVPVAAYGGYFALFKNPPQITVFSETLYPKQVERNAFFFLAYDLSFSESCSISATRIIKASDGTEYVIGSDRRDVVEHERERYVVRIPIPASVPYGRASIRSDIEYGCDIWSRYVASRTVKGMPRVVEVVPEGASDQSLSIPSYKLSWLPDFLELDRPRTRRTLPAGG